MPAFLPNFLAPWVRFLPTNPSSAVSLSALLHTRCFCCCSAGEMVFPWMFEDFAELQKVREAAELVAADTGEHLWGIGIRAKPGL